MDLTKFINKFACDEAYYGDHDFITNSQMGHLKKSPLAYQKYKKHGMPDTNALIFGRAFHWAILEPEKFEEKTHIFTGKVRRGKAWDEFSSENKDKTIITAVEFECIKGMEGAITSGEAANLLEGIYEKAHVWEFDGIKCKGKVDIYDPISNTIIDINWSFRY